MAVSTIKIIMILLMLNIVVGIGLGATVTTNEDIRLLSFETQGEIIDSENTEFKNEENLNNLQSTNHHHHHRLFYRIVKIVNF